MSVVSVYKWYIYWVFYISFSANTEIKKDQRRNNETQERLNNEPWNS